MWESSTPSTPFTLRSTIPIDDTLGLPIPAPIIYNDTSSFLKSWLDQPLDRVLVQVRVEDDVSGLVGEGYTTLCHLMASGWQDELTVVLKPNHSFAGIAYHALRTGECLKNAPATVQPLTTHVKLAHAEPGALPGVVAVKAPVDPNGPPEEQEKTFFQKYWFLLVGIAMLVLTSGGGGGESSS
ncbi:hypothetical protein BZG36_03038 [Bifiguratus adelaidae]|uniref:ER membrane protein complex subunit 10 n=1 Tax=Bifiguratus adelaidae TaxID=1938954 RepID=A0A261XYZ8_9FUNG|nr:hypothetical protein BZG36_03038 [Bifiguratus adelaidae]